MFGDMGKVNDIADRYVGQFAELDPLVATSVGINGFDHLMTDLSPEGFAARAALDRATIAELESVEASGGEDFAKQAMLERLTIACELYESGALNSELNVIASRLQGVREVFDLMPVHGEQAQRNLADRMSDVASAYAGLRRTYMDAAAQGCIAPRRQVLACVKQCADWSADGSDFYSSLVARTGAAGAIRADLDRAATSARRATAEFGRFLETELLPHARNVMRQAEIAMGWHHALSWAPRLTSMRHTPGAGPR
jgi:uncharacterized protein (DUF885 family)